MLVEPAAGTPRDPQHKVRHIAKVRAAEPYAGDDVPVRDFHRWRGTYEAKGAVPCLPQSVIYRRSPSRLSGGCA